VEKNMTVSVTTLTTSDWEHWVEQIEKQCFNQATIQHLGMFFRILMEKIERAGKRGELDLSDRSKLRLEICTEDVTFYRNEEPSVLMRGDTMAISVLDPQDRFLMRSCFLRKANVGNHYIKMFWPNEVSVWNEARDAA
jgi:hypothetical protein